MATDRKNSLEIHFHMQILRHVILHNIFNGLILSFTVALPLLGAFTIYK